MRSVSRIRLAAPKEDGAGSIDDSPSSSTISLNVPDDEHDENNINGSSDNR